MSKQTQLPWASSSSASSTRSSKDDRDIDMKHHPLPPSHLNHRTIYKANRSHSLTQHTATTSFTPFSAPASGSSVLGKRGSGGGLPFVFLDGEQPLDYTDFTQIKLPVHTLLYLCADSHYNNKHFTQHTDEDYNRQHHHNNNSSNGSSRMNTVMEDDTAAHDTLTPHTSLPQPQPDTVRYDSIAPTGEEGEQSSNLFTHHPFHRFYRSYKAAVLAWKQRQGQEKDSGGRVMEFACREALHVLHVNAQQRVAVFASASASSSVLSTVSAWSYVPSPPPLLSHLLSAHNDCVGYEVEGDKADGIVLTSSACECQLSLLDDDKRAHVSQALLTDMFARLHC